MLRKGCRLTQLSAPRAAGRQGSGINAHRGGLGMRSVGVPGEPCHARPCGWARAALRGRPTATSSVLGRCQHQKRWKGKGQDGPSESALTRHVLREYILCSSESGGLFPLGAGRESILSTSGSCGFFLLGASRELILSTSGSRGFFPLGASQRFARRSFVSVTIWLHRRSSKAS